MYVVHHPFSASFQHLGTSSPHKVHHLTRYQGMGVNGGRGYRVRERRLGRGGALQVICHLILCIFIYIYIYI